MMAKMTISLPESVRAYIQEKVQKDGYGTVSEYIRELVRSDQKAETAKTKTALRRDRESDFIWNESSGDIYDPYTIS